MNNTPRYQPSKREWIGNAIKLKLNGRKSLKMYPLMVYQIMDLLQVVGP